MPNPVIFVVCIVLIWHAVKAVYIMSDEYFTKEQIWYNEFDYAVVKGLVKFWFYGFLMIALLTVCN